MHIALPVQTDISQLIVSCRYPFPRRTVRTRVNLGDVPVYFVGRQQFVANKRAIGRKRDLADLEALGEE